MAYIVPGLSIYTQPGVHNVRAQSTRNRNLRYLSLRRRFEFASRSIARSSRSILLSKENVPSSMSIPDDRLLTNNQARYIGCEHSLREPRPRRLFICRFLRYYAYELDSILWARLMLRRTSEARTRGAVFSHLHFM